jgi:hypothetical protein
MYPCRRQTFGSAAASLPLAFGIPRPAKPSSQNTPQSPSRTTPREALPRKTLPQSPSRATPLRALPGKLPRSPSRAIHVKRSFTWKRRSNEAGRGIPDARSAQGVTSGAEFAPTREQSLLRRGSERAFTLAWKRAIRSPRRRVIAPLSPLRSAAPGPCCGSP